MTGTLRPNGGEVTWEASRVASGARAAWRFARAAWYRARAQHGTARCVQARANSSTHCARMKTHRVTSYVTVCLITLGAAPLIQLIQRRQRYVVMRQRTQRRRDATRNALRVNAPDL